MSEDYIEWDKYHWINLKTGKIISKYFPTLAGDIIN